MSSGWVVVVSGGAGAGAGAGACSSSIRSSSPSRYRRASVAPHLSKACRAFFASSVNDSLGRAGSTRNRNIPRCSVDCSQPSDTATNGAKQHNRANFFAVVIKAGCFFRRCCRPFRARLNRCRAPLGLFCLLAINLSYVSPNLRDNASTSTRRLNDAWFWRAYLAASSRDCVLSRRLNSRKIATVARASENCCCSVIRRRGRKWATSCRPWSRVKARGSPSVVSSAFFLPASKGCRNTSRQPRPRRRRRTCHLNTPRPPRRPRASQCSRRPPSRATNSPRGSTSKSSPILRMAPIFTSDCRASNTSRLWGASKASASSCAGWSSNNNALSATVGRGARTISGGMYGGMLPIDLLTVEPDAGARRDAAATAGALRATRPGAVSCQQSLRPRPRVVDR